MSNPQLPQESQGSKIDIDKLGAEKHYDVDIRIKSPKELIDHIKELIPILLASIIAVIVVIQASIVLNNPKSTSDDKKTAQSLITLIVGIVVGYGFGKAEKTHN